MNKLFHFISVLALLCLLTNADAQSLSERQTEYKIQPSDVLSVEYRLTPELNQEVTVRPDGRISINGIGDVFAAGLTPAEAAQKVRDVSQIKLVDPEVTVLVKEFQKPFVIVGGEVSNPGRFELRGDLTAIEAISLAGGLKNTSKHSQVLLLRKTSGDLAETKVLDLKALINTRKLEEDIFLKSGDMLYVPQNNISKIERLVHLGNVGLLYNPVH